MLAQEGSLPEAVRLTQADHLPLVQAAHDPYVAPLANQVHVPHVRLPMVLLRVVRRPVELLPVGEGQAGSVNVGPGQLCPDLVCQNRRLVVVWAIGQV